MIVTTLNDYHSDSVAWLRTQKDVRLAMESEQSSSEALLIRSNTSVDTRLLNQFPNLKLIITATSGFDHIDWKLCQSRNITAAFCPNANGQSAAEHTLMLILNALKNFSALSSNLRGGKWRQGLTRGHTLHGKTLGLIGLGRIGSTVARMARSFGADIIAYDPYQNVEHFSALGARRLGFVEVLRECDILSMHVPYTTETHHMLNRSTLEELSDHAWIINVSRGNLIEESDLVTAMREGHIGGAAMDVFAKEPMEATSFLIKEKRLVLTPHAGAFTEEAWRDSSMEAARKCVDFAKGLGISDTLPLNTPWFGKIHSI